MKTKERNQTLEFLRILAAVFVVFLHVPFPGLLGKTVNCLARFAVPLFFAISGWFSYRVEPRALGRRFLRSVELELTAILVTVLWKWIMGQCVLLPTADALSQWLLWNVDPFAGHLWYLSAAAACYGVLWLYAMAFRDREIHYRPLYILSVLLLAAHFAMGNFSRFTGIAVDYTRYRNAWFFGIPMFSMGILLRQYRQQAEKLRWLLLPALALSLLERWILGPSDLPVAMPLAVAALLLLAQAYPRVPEPLAGMSRWFGPLSTTVYILHLLVYDAYSRLNLAFPAEPWLRPIIVAAASILVSALWLTVKNNVKKRIK